MAAKRPFLSTLPRLTWLLLLFPAVIAMKVAHIEGLPLFAVSALAILGTVTLIGKATEEIALYAGPLWGGLLNATFGNVTELIIALFALKAGIDAGDAAAQEKMFDVVRFSLVGSIIGNLLLILGGAMLYGGMKYSVQRFSRTGANINIGMLWLVLITMAVPSLVKLGFSDEQAAASGDLIGQLSMAAALVLLILYGLNLLFSLKTHRFHLMPAETDHDEAEWSKMTAAVMLGIATLLVAFLSESFVHSIEFMVEHKTVQMSEMFIGVIIVAIVGNAAEGMVAIWVARQDKMELSFQIAMGSCLQVALMVAPVLVISSALMGQLMPLTFGPFELMSLAASVMIASTSLNDGESNWLEGAMFLSVYLFFAMVFWFHP
ncbi:MAG: calcium/proton exchanger [Planctomycetaceae bacterium]|nr:calcium/proton exchanger [Planctomycetaceae bacterium]